MSPAARPRPATPVKPAGHRSTKATALQVAALPAASWLAMNATACGVTVSLLLHGLLLGTGFINPASGLRKERDPGMQVVLVNARHKHAPKHAQALAQANLDGGGDSDKKDAMPASPLPPQDTSHDGDALVDSQKKVQQLEAIQRALLARTKASELAARNEHKSPRTEQPDNTPQPRSGLDMTTATAIARQEAIVSNGLREYAARPRKGVISPSTREYKLAQYGEDWRIRVQRIGELNFPRGAQGSLYGNVQVDVILRPDGSLQSATINVPSADPKLNEAALRIIKLGAPYAAFPPEIRKDYDIIELVRTLNFTRENIGVSSQ